jgi:hypothetical protein
MTVKNLFNRVAFGKAIDESRYTIQEIAEMVPCRPNDLYRYRKGEATPRINRLKRLVEILGPSITGLSISGQRGRSLRFNQDEQQHLNWFRGLPLYQQARMLGAFAAIYEYGPDADESFAADFAERLIAEEQQHKEQPG